MTITALGHSGDGVAETANGRVYVPFTLPGETATIERDGERSSLVHVDAPSPQRVAPICRHFGVCGNCALQHMERAAYLAWKRERVAAAFAQRGIDAAIAQTIAVPIGSRRRAIFSAIRTAKGVILGFHRRASDEIIAVEECPVLVPTLVAALPKIRAIADIMLPRWKAARLIVLAADNGLCIAINGAGRPTDEMLARLGAFGADMALARLTVDGTEIFRNRAPELQSGPVALFPTPGGFVQASAAAEAALAEAVMAHVGPEGPIADLFAGIGTFSFRLAERGAVTAVEGEAALVAAIGEAGRRAGKRSRVTARRRDLFTNPLAPNELSAFAAVVFDPPAAGAKAQAEALARSAVPRVVAVSCNPATLARDARILIDGGYRLESVVPVDQFLFSAEIEAVAAFVR